MPKIKSITIDDSFYSKMNLTRLNLEGVIRAKLILEYCINHLLKNAQLNKISERNVGGRVFLVKCS